MSAETGKWVIFIGAIILIAGVIIYYFHDYFRWIGRLPGDIRIEKGNVRVYIPITTMILFSLLLTLLFRLIRKFLG